MGNTDSQPNQSTEGTEICDSGLGSSSNPPSASNLTHVELTEPASTSQNFDRNSFQSGSSSPLLTAEEYKKVDGLEDMYLGGNSQEGSLASSFNESEIMARSAGGSGLNKGRTVPTIITWSQGGNNVYVTGTFNNWKQNVKLCKSSNDFNTMINLTPGTHKLKFIVDGEWKCSNELEIATDPDGNLVNYVEVFEDEDAVTMDQDTLNGANGQAVFCGTPPGEYTSEIPGYLLAYEHSLSVTENNIIHHQRNPSATMPEDPFESSECMAENQPPSLPPHLEKVLLNSSSVSKEDNSVLPVPNHVVLNHLYACSIRDGVMAVSSTARYRKKYMTTIFYQPIFT